MRRLSILLASGAAITAVPAAAEPVTLTPIVDARLRYEGVEQDGIPNDANAVTMRMRAGGELVTGPWALLMEGEGTLAIRQRYNSTTNGRTFFPIVADPQNVELNRIHLQYKGFKKTTLTLGRQRINLDDQRFVGSVAWRQNEQSFDAVRVESAALGPMTVDLTYSWSERTIYGVDSPLQAIHGDNVFANIGVKLGSVTAKGFAYLIDQDKTTRRQFSSQTYGLRGIGAFPLGKAAKLTLIGSYARQSDYAGNPDDYSADYWLGEAALAAMGVTVTAGYEVLGSGFQTPLATLHKFQGWADKFLTTPANGIRDAYASAGYAIPKTPIGPVNLLVAYHDFGSDRQSIPYGHEWDAQVGIKTGRHTALLVKFAGYQADRFATDTQKLWLQFDYTL